MAPPFGELAALAGAFLFAFTSVLFTEASGRTGAVGANTFKVVAGTLLFAVALLIRDGVPWARGLAGADVAMLALSGLVGLSLGDSLLFVGFLYLGTRRTMLVASLNPIFGAAGGIWLLGESLGWAQWSGIALALGGVGLVMAEGMQSRELSTRAWVLGGLCGLGAAFGQAAGALLAKAPLERVDTLMATQVRVAAAAAGLLLLAALRGRLRQLFDVGRDRRTLGRLATASFLGPFLSIWLMIISLKLTETGVALALLSTAPLWMLPLGRVMQGDRPTARESLGAIVAIAGVVLLLLS